MKPRFYVATSPKEAYSSWDTLEDAWASVLRFEEHDPKGAAEIIGIIEVCGPPGTTRLHPSHKDPSVPQTLSPPTPK